MTQFLVDQNMDGAFTISDVWIIIKWLGCLPGNILFDAIAEWLPSMARFFEITPNSQYGAVAWGISAFFWMIVALYLLAVFE